MRISLFLSLSCACLLLGIVYSATKFRTEKMNFIYEKALQHIDDRKRLGRLENELQTFDKIYMDTKTSVVEAKDMGKEYTRIDTKLADMLEKYDLQHAVQAFKNKKKFRNEYEMENENLVNAGEKFTDPRLQKLWDGAMLAKFGEQEMKDLHADLKQAERKIFEYNDILEDFVKVPHENSLHFDDPAALDAKNKRLKQAHRAMYEHLDEVHKKITNEEFSPFEDYKVKKLWKTAQSNDKLKPHDLEIIKEELIHFEKQLQKLEFHEKEVIAMKIVSEEQGKSDIRWMEERELDEKHDRMRKKLKKLENYITDKIRHSEL